MALHKQLELIKESDLEDLILNQTSEGKKIEYKKTIFGNKDSDKKEFLADVSSFANTMGGDIIYGLEEVDGIPKTITGLKETNVDALKLRIESIIQNGVRPRIPNIKVHDVKCSSGTVIIIRIPRSWASPHMVTFGNHSKFFSRNSAGKYQLDVDELRTAFLISETGAERIRNFRIDRLGKIISGDTPILLKDTPKIVFHIVPFNAFDLRVKLDIINTLRDFSKLRPLGANSWNHRYNFDGILTYSTIPNTDFAYSYLQIFQNGILEAVQSSLLKLRDDRKIIPSIAFEEYLIKGLPNLLTIQRQIGVEPPLFIMLSLLDVQGYIMGVDTSRFLYENFHPIDKKDLVIPEIMIESFECEYAKVLKPLFDSVWNATGHAGSINYDSNEEWVGR